jgi:hypothetical protein
VKYAQKQDFRDLFHQHDDGFACVRSGRLRAEASSGSAELSLNPSRVAKRSKWQDRGIIPEQSPEGRVVRAGNQNPSPVRITPIIGSRNSRSPHSWTEEDMGKQEPPEIRIVCNSSAQEVETRERFYKTFTQCPIPSNELLANLGLFINRQSLSRIIFMHEIYQRIIPVNGIIAEFGVRWGQNLALFSSFRGMYEPYNYGRKLVGFDTFSGFPSVSEYDGNDPVASVGAYGVSSNYETYLDAILTYHEMESPLSHIKKYELIKGDATVTLEKYLQKHPETIIALAYFDFDIYEPTKRCLELIKDCVTKGSVIGFDELNWPSFPGETKALKEVFGLSRYAIRRSPLNPGPSYIVIE